MSAHEVQSRHAAARPRLPKLTHRGHYAYRHRQVGVPEGMLPMSLTSQAKAAGIGALRLAGFKNLML
jgi:hypothetical protein